MVAKNFKRGLHQCSQDLFPFALWQIFPDGFGGDVLRGGRTDPILAFVPNHQMTIGDAGIKLDDFRADLFVQIIDELFGF